MVFVKVGVFENTKDPVPTSFETAADKFALVGEAKNVCISAVALNNETTTQLELSKLVLPNL